MRTHLFNALAIAATMTAAPAVFAQDSTTTGNALVAP